MTVADFLRGENAFMNAIQLTLEDRMIACFSSFL